LRHFRIESLTKQGIPRLGEEKTLKNRPLRSAQSHRTAKRPEREAFRP